MVMRSRRYAATRLNISTVFKFEGRMKQ